MTIDISRILPYGPLERSEVYFDHDGPKFFSLRSTSLGVRLLALCTAEDEETLEYLYLVMSPDRFNRARSGGISLREAFEAAAPGEIWRVVENYGEHPPSATATSIVFDEIPATDLPDAEARIELPTPTAPLLDFTELRTLSSSSLRTYAVLELDASGQNLTEFPLGNLGTIALRFQEAIDALAQEEVGRPTARGSIPANIATHVQMNAVGLRAASFALLLATDDQGVLVEYTQLVEATLMRLLHLVEAGHNPNEAVNTLRDYGARARSKVVSLLVAASDADSGFGVVVSPQAGEPNHARLSAREVREVVQFVKTVKPTEEPIYVQRGHLIGSNTRTKTFELEDITGQKPPRYAGRVEESAIPKIDGLRVGSTSLVRATLRGTVEFSPADPEGGRKYSLVDIEELK